GVTANQHHRAGHKSATKNTIKFPRTAGKSGQILQADFRQSLHSTACGRTSVTLKFCRTIARRRTQTHFGQAVPDTAFRALTLPLAVFRTTVIAYKSALGFRHGLILVEKS